MSRPDPCAKRSVLIVDPELHCGLEVAMRLDSSFITASTVAAVGPHDVTRSGPDLVLLSQDYATPGGLAAIRRCGPDGVQSIVVLTHHGPPPPSIIGYCDSYIWCGVGAEALARFVERALGRRSSLIRMRAAQVKREAK